MKGRVQCGRLPSNSTHFPLMSTAPNSSLRTNQTPGSVRTQARNSVRQTRGPFERRAGGFARRLTAGAEGRERKGRRAVWAHGAPPELAVLVVAEADDGGGTEVLLVRVHHRLVVLSTTTSLIS